MLQIDKIQGHIMTDTESMICEMNESSRAFQKLMDALGEIENTRLLTKEEINSLPEHDKKMEEEFRKMVIEPLRKWLEKH